MSLSLGNFGFQSLESWHECLYTYLTSSLAVGNGARTKCRGIIKNAWRWDGAVSSAWGTRQLRGREPGDTLTDAERNDSISDMCRCSLSLKPGLFLWGEADADWYENNFISYLSRVGVKF